MAGSKWQSAQRIYVSQFNKKKENILSIWFYRKSLKKGIQEQLVSLLHAYVLIRHSCDSMDCCPPGSFVHGILQARILEWVAISSSRGSSWPRKRTRGSEPVFRDPEPMSLVSPALEEDSLPTEPPEKS